MHGIGNDYVYVNCFEETVENPSEVAVFVSERHFGIGSDGLILIKPSSIADCEMEMYNADGSKGAMCGNGVRCVAKYVYDYGIVKKDTITVATGSGIKIIDLTIENGKAVLARVDMGEPILKAVDVPVIADTETVVSAPIHVCGKDWEMTCVSMGNPHAVVPVENVTDFEIEKYGPSFEKNERFPNRINTEFIRVLGRDQVQMRVWERGSDETWACGTGACAVAVACILNGWTDRKVTVHLRGGDLMIEWDEATNHVFMTGPATVVFDGEIHLEEHMKK